ncbi:metal-sulfur cluster assembly factor [Brevibacillus massiliensis]|uniref:metal-sulfur cluster assembly factor n=1 Tax=Brevibacillus massiliensis TaxID=1118054 RepID=UPI0002FF7343|nr:metal-sulfur cluster assembly factor [Brevibacillus massiliensis]
MNVEEKVWAALEEVIDPELGINIVDLGLVYDVDVDESRNVSVTMTLTTPGCPLHGFISDEVTKKVKGIPEVNEVEVNLVWEPAWTPARMNDKAREEFRQRQGML